MQGLGAMACAGVSDSTMLDPRWWNTPISLCSIGQKRPRARSCGIRKNVLRVFYHSSGNAGSLQQAHHLIGSIIDRPRFDHGIQCTLVFLPVLQRVEPRISRQSLVADCLTRRRPLRFAATAIVHQRSSPLHGYTLCGAAQFTALPLRTGSRPFTAVSRRPGSRKYSAVSNCARSMIWPFPSGRDSPKRR